MEKTFRQPLPKAKLASTQKWREENDVKVAFEDDPNNEHYVTEVIIIAPNDYVLGQAVNQLGLSLEERRARPRRTWRRFWRKKPRS